MSTSAPKAALDWDAIGQESLALFQALLRVDTTNPPGAERAAIALLADWLREDGLEPWIVESAPERANLVVRLPATHPIPGQGPLLLAGHVDVVPADASAWTHPPFAGEIHDGMVWGRGAVDMKNMVTMCAMVMRLFARSGTPRTRDIIFAAVADEEEGCTYGSQFLVDNHPERVQADYMLGEVGGFWLTLGSQVYVPVMVAEKGQVHLRLSASGPSAHGAIPHEDNALARIARAIDRLSTTRLPHHTTPVTERFISELAAAQPFPTRQVLRGLLNARASGPILDRVMPDRANARTFNALLHNTVSATMMKVGVKRNVIPPEAAVDLDGRILPGQSADDLVREVRAVIADPQVQIEVISAAKAPVVEDFDGPLFAVIREVVGQHAPEARCVPYMIPGFTDARAFSQLGTRCFGFSPLKLDPAHKLKFSELFHGVDERAPVDGFLWGQRVLWEVVTRFVAPAEG
jgi:acetylornithine deacetylase/succinyl-diaminopimelate desuccinylase-like protein